MEKENRVPESSFVLRKQGGGWRRRALMAVQKGRVDRLDVSALCLRPNKAGPFLLQPRFFLEPYLLPVRSQIHFKLASAPLFLLSNFALTFKFYTGRKHVSCGQTHLYFVDLPSVFLNKHVSNKKISCFSF